MHGSSTLDYDAVPASLADAAVTPGDPAYGRLTSTYFRGGAPGIVLLPRTIEQVVDAALQPHGWALSSGDSGSVGVGGLATSGGIGLLARAHGLTIDRLVAAHVVLADGSVVVADEHENRELFWAVRGAGANFGVVVSFDFVVDEVDQVGLALLTHLAQDPASFLVASSAPRDTTTALLAGPGDAESRRGDGRRAPGCDRLRPPRSASPGQRARRRCA